MRASSAWVRGSMLLATAAFSSTMSMELMPDRAMLTFLLFITKRRAISAEDCTLPGSRSWMTLEGAPRRPPPTGPMMVTPRPCSCA